MKTNHCLHCGNVIMGDWRYCNVCGTHRGFKKRNESIFGKLVRFINRWC